jgi:hypothetical protein
LAQAGPDLDTIEFRILHFSTYPTKGGLDGNEKSNETRREMIVKLLIKAIPKGEKMARAEALRALGPVGVEGLLYYSRVRPVGDAKRDSSVRGPHPGPVLATSVDRGCLCTVRMRRQEQTSKNFATRSGSSILDFTSYLESR